MGRRSRSRSRERSRRKKDRKRSRSRSYDRDRERKRDRKRSRSSDKKQEKSRDRKREKSRDRESRRSRSRETERRESRKERESVKPDLKLPEKETKKEEPVVKVEKSSAVEAAPKKSRFSGGLEAWRKAHAVDAAKKAKVAGEVKTEVKNEVLAPNKVEIPGFPKAMKGVAVFKPEPKKDDGDSFTDADISERFDLAKLARETMERRKNVERWRREQKRKIVHEVTEDIRDEKRRQRRQQLHDKTQPWVEDGESDEEAEDVQSQVKKTDEDKMQEDEDEDPLDAYMSNLKDSMGKNSGIVMEEKKSAESKVSHVVASRVVAVKPKGSGRGDLIEANQDEPEYSSEEEDETLGDTLVSWTQKQRKLLEHKIDHGQINYEPFKKTFYTEVPSIAKLTTQEVKLQRATELDGVRIRGKNCPKPIKTWAQSGCSSKVLTLIKRMKFEKPTPIQAQCLPAIMSGRDVIGIAKTGSGKTLGFVLPMLRHMEHQREVEKGEGPIAVIMTPTRELAIQITKDTRKFANHMRWRTVCVYGGTGISEQISELKRGAEIIICTPGRMIDMLAANNGRVTNLRRCTYCVLDEADRMFDMGFEPQVMHILNSVRPDRQLVLFSATFPRSMEALARRILTKPLEITVGGKSVVCDDVQQNVVVLNDEDKFLKLLELLGRFQESGSVIVFTHKHEVADALLKEVLKAGYPAQALHGGMDQYDRDSVINDFKKGVSNLLIATSVAARGLDVKNLILVVNFDCPNHYEDYVHRCGRTGRAGNKGTAYTFLTEEEGKYAGDIIKALEMSKAEVPKHLENLWERYKLNQEKLGKTVQKSSGFSGSGFKFDEAENQMDKDRKNMQKQALGYHESDDEDTGNVDIDKQIEMTFKSKKSVKETVVGTDEQADKADVGRDNQQKLAQAKKMAEKINAKRGSNQSETQQTAHAVMNGQNLQPIAAPKVSNKLIADQIAARLNAKLCYVPMERPDGTSGATPLEGMYTTTYEEELEINDFPQSCRWKVTSREAIGNITDYSEAEVQIRGVYYPPGKEPGEGEERKLYLLITGRTERAIQMAKGEITRIIKDEFTRLQTSYQAPKVGRFKVL